MTSSSHDTAAALDLLARRLARNVATRAECYGAPRANTDTLTELESIHRCNLARAWRATGGIIPDVGALFGQDAATYLLGMGRLGMAANAWRCAIERASKESQREIDRRRAAARRAVSLDDDREENATESAKVERALHARAVLIPGKVTRRTFRHARESLVAYWTLAGSRKFRASLASDLLLLARLARVARGASFGILGEITGDFNASAVRKSIQRLILRIGQGDILATDSPDIAEQSLTQWRAERVLSRSLERQLR